MLDNATFEALCILTEAHHFTRRGNAFFRAYNGVIEVIKFCYEPHGARYDLFVGMHSMYSEFKAQWFTSRGCIPSFSVMKFIDVYDTSISVPEGFQVSPPVSPDVQLAILRYHGMPWLDTITSQLRFANGWTYLSLMGCRHIKTLPSTQLLPLYAPYLKCKEYGAAEVIIDRKIEQSRNALQQRLKDGSISNKMVYSNSERWQNLKELAASHDEERINAYLTRNYNQNYEYVKFCIRDFI